jgi:hypothetical protein
MSLHSNLEKLDLEYNQFIFDADCASNKLKEIIVMKLMMKMGFQIPKTTKFVPLTILLKVIL